MDQNIAQFGKVNCPVCGDEIDFTTEKGQEAALQHMKKDGPHQRHLQRVQTEQFLDRMCGTGILRRV